MAFAQGINPLSQLVNSLRKCLLCLMQRQFPRKVVQRRAALRVRVDGEGSLARCRKHPCARHRQLRQAVWRVFRGDDESQRRQRLGRHQGSPEFVRRLGNTALAIKPLSVGIRYRFRWQSTAKISRSEPLSIRTFVESCTLSRPERKLEQQPRRTRCLSVDTRKFP